MDFPLIICGKYQRVHVGFSGKFFNIKFFFEGIVWKLKYSLKINFKTRNQFKIQEDVIIFI